LGPSTPTSPSIDHTPQGSPTIYPDPALPLPTTHPILSYSTNSSPDYHFVVPVEITSEGSPSIKTIALIDSGATSNFIDRRFASQNQILLNNKSQPQPVLVIDGRPLRSGPITHHAQTKLTIGHHQEALSLDAIGIANYPVILGMPWLRQHNPEIDWRRNKLQFLSGFCSRTCIQNPSAVSAVPFVPSVSQPEFSQEDDSVNASTILQRALTLSTLRRS
jgi:Retroviral aspartyl protease